MMAKRTPWLLVAAAVFCTPGAWADESNPLFGYTHMLSSPFTLPAGKVVIGTSIGLGITDFLSVGTDVVRDIYQVYNAHAKLGVINTHDFAAALTGGWESYNYHDIDNSNPDIQVTSWQPGFVVGYEILPDLAQFVGGNLSYSNTTQNVAGTQIAGFQQGAQIESDFSWAHGASRRPTNLVLSVGASYDFTYKLVGVGASYHIPGLHFGFHYYPNADKYKFQPIIVGGTSLSF
jgi:hypothetical protein